MPTPKQTFDASLYLRHCEDWERTDDEQQMLLAPLWKIMAGFAELGFDLSPVSALPGTHNEQSTNQILAREGVGMLGSEHSAQELLTPDHQREEDRP